MVKPNGWKSRQEFTREMYPRIQRIVRGTGLLPGTALAQAIIESSGKYNGQFRVGGSSLSRKANNYFGIKCHSGWKGKRYNSRTREETSSGASYYVNSCFRAYPSIEASIKDWVKFLQTNRRYRKVFQQRTVKGQIQALKNAGYATAGGYVNAVYDVYKSQLPTISEIDSTFQVKKYIMYAAGLGLIAYIASNNILTNEKRTQLY